MTIAWNGSLIEAIIYLLCVATSLLCAYLLARAYHRGRTKLLIWSALCFALLALNNLVVAADVLLLPTIDGGGDQHESRDTHKIEPDLIGFWLLH